MRTGSLSLLRSVVDPCGNAAMLRCGGVRIASQNVRDVFFGRFHRPYRHYSQPSSAARALPELSRPIPNARGLHLDG